MIKLALILMLPLFQSMALVHATETGDEPHTHNGNKCVIGALLDRSDDDQQSASFTLQLPAFKTEQLVIPDQPLSLLSSANQYAIRGPPAE